MTRLLLISLLVTVSGCSTIREYWPRAHDPVMFDHLVRTDIEIAHVDCDHPNWTHVHHSAEVLAQYAEWRADPQADNLKGLVSHTERMAKSTSKTFCELGKKTAQQRIEAARTAWKGR